MAQCTIWKQLVIIKTACFYLITTCKHENAGPYLEADCLFHIPDVQHSIIQIIVNFVTSNWDLFDKFHCPSVRRRKENCCCGWRKSRIISGGRLLTVMAIHSYFGRCSAAQHIMLSTCMTSSPSTSSTRLVYMVISHGNKRWADYKHR